MGRQEGHGIKKEKQRIEQSSLSAMLFFFLKLGGIYLNIQYINSPNT